MKQKDTLDAVEKEISTAHNFLSLDASTNHQNF